MAFSVTDFSSQLTFGGARPSLFEVQIFNPINAAGNLKTPFMVRSAQLPASTVGTINMPYFGRQIKIAGNRTFAEWTPTIINDEDFLIYNAMQEWAAAINNHRGNIRSAGPGPADYKSTATVTQFGKDGAVLRTVEFVGLWCSDVQAIDLNWETEGVEEFSVTFQYDYWQVVGGSTGTGNTQA